MRLPNLLRNGRFLSYLILTGIAGVMIYTVAPSLNADGYLSAWDANGHLLKALWFAHHILPEGHLNGYFPLWHGGFSLFQFYPPLLYYVLGPLALVFQPELALRLVTAGVWIALVPVTYYFLRSWHASRILAAAGTGLLLALNASFGLGLGALYGVGLLPNGLGGVLAIFALGRLKRDLTWPDRGTRQFLLTGIAIALLILAHTFSTYWFAIASVILLIAYSVGEKAPLEDNFRRFSLVWIIALLLSAYWWFPLLLDLDGMGPTGTVQQTPLGEQVRSLVLAKGTGGWPASILALAGLAHLGLARRFRALAFFTGLLAVSLLLSLNLINQALPFHDVIASSQYIRFQAFFSWLLLMLSVFGLIGAWQLVRRLPLPYVPSASFLGLLILLYALVVLPSLRDNSGFVSVVDNQPTRELPAVVNFLKQNLRPGEFVLSEFNWESRNYFGSPHFVNQHLSRDNEQIWDLDGNFPEGTNGSARPVLVASVLDQTGYLGTQHDYLVSRGIRFLITTSDINRPKLASISWLKPIVVENQLAVYEIVDFRTPFGLPVELGSQLKDVSFSDDAYHLTFRRPVDLPAGTTTALSFHPWLQLEAGGKTVRGKRDREDRLVTAGGLTQVQAVDIHYHPPFGVALASWLSGLARLAVLLLLIKPNWLPRRRAR